MLVGNNLDVKLGRPFAMHPSKIDGGRVSTLVMQIPGDDMSFQIISARHLWDWRLYPSSKEERRVEDRSSPSVNVSLLWRRAGTGHNKDFQLQGLQGKTIILFVFIGTTTNDLRIWYKVTQPPTGVKVSHQLPVKVETELKLDEVGNANLSWETAYQMQQDLVDGFAKQSVQDQLNHWGEGPSTAGQGGD